MSGDVYASIDDFTQPRPRRRGSGSLGVSLTLAIPFLVGLSAGLSLLIPGFLVLAVCKVANKAFDYASFESPRKPSTCRLGSSRRPRAKRDLPLGQGRGSLHGAIMLGLQHGAMALALVLMGVWLYATVRVLRKYQQLLDSGSLRPKPAVMVRVEET